MYKILIVFLLSFIVVLPVYASEDIPNLENETQNIEEKKEQESAETSKEENVADVEKVPDDSEVTDSPETTVPDKSEVTDSTKTETGSKESEGNTVSGGSIGTEETEAKKEFVSKNIVSGNFIQKDFLVSTLADSGTETLQMIGYLDYKLQFVGIMLFLIFLLLSIILGCYIAQSVSSFFVR